MSEGEEIKKEELQEMARAILSEIYGAESTKNGFEGLDIFPRVSRNSFGFADEGLGRSGERLSYGQAYSFNSQAAQSADSEGLVPRLSRNDFLEQRVFRRRLREGAHGTLSEKADGVAVNTVELSGRLPQTDLPEKLSDIFCRDARRYDGAFEKY